MRRIIHISLLICLISCQQNGLDAVQVGAPVYIAASVGGDSMTKAPYMPENNQGHMVETPSPEHPLKTDVWGSTTSYIFTEEFYDQEKTRPWDGSDESGKVAIHTDATFQSGDPQLLRAAIYNKNTKPTVYFVAFSPISQGAEKWVASEDGKSASFVFSGNDDVMFAPQVQGTYATDYSKSPVLSYSHLLTWLRVEMQAESKEVSDSWGAIKSITIRSNSNVKIDLQKEAYNNDGTYNFENVVFSEETDMNLYKTIEEESYDGAQVTMKKKFTDEVFTDIKVPYLKKEELAYVLCAPVVGTDKKVVDGEEIDAEEYVITISTDKRNVAIPVDLRHMVSGVVQPFLGSTRCMQFTLSLNFKMGNTIYLTSSVQDWNVGGLVVGNIGDGNIQ
jgi:hypothetical protein